MKTAQSTDWKTLPLPKSRSTIRLDRLFSAQEMERIRQGLIPEQMEDKWFLYWQDDRLFFHRSWTGLCIFVVRFAPEGESYRMLEAEVNRDPEQYGQTSDDEDAHMISTLIDLLLLQRSADLGDEPLAQWKLVGRAMLGQHPRGE